MWLRQHARVGIVAVAFAVAAAFAPGGGASKVCDITDYGAVGDGKTLNTDAIKAAIEACTSSPLSHESSADLSAVLESSPAINTILIPGPSRSPSSTESASNAPAAATTQGTMQPAHPQRSSSNGSGSSITYLSAPFTLPSYTSLYIGDGTTLAATTDASLWPVIRGVLPSYPRPVENDGNMTGYYAPFIGTAPNATHVTLGGPGRIDGQGRRWWFASGRLPGHKKTILHTRPRLFQPTFASNVTVRDLTIVDAPFWVLHFYACDSVLVENTTITAPIWSRNTDCIDPDSSTNVLIRNCSLAGGDDQVAIKSGQDEPGRLFGRPSAGITIEDVKIKWGDGISIGSEMSGGVHDVLVRNVQIYDVLHPLRIKTGYGRGGTVQNITFEDIAIGGVAAPPLQTGRGRRIRAHGEEQAPSISIAGTAITVDEFDGNIPANASHARDGWPVVRNVTFRRVTARDVLTAGVFKCIPEMPCTGIVLENITVHALHGFSCSNISGPNSASTVQPPSCISHSKV
jgi:polygalacturonase